MKINYPRISTSSNDEPKPFFSGISDTSTTTIERIIPKDSIDIEILRLKNVLQKIETYRKPEDTLSLRAKWISDNLQSLRYLLDIEQGKTNSDLDFESIQLLNLHLPEQSEEHFKQLNLKLDSLIPGSGTLTERFFELRNRFTIPKDKIDTVFKMIISETRNRTKQFIVLPDNETVTIQYTTNKFYSGVYQYLGNSKGLILINIAYPISLIDAIETACHEGYAGHHVHNILLRASQKSQITQELNFSLNKGPQGFINEAIPSYSREMIFPKNDMKKYIKDVLIPLTGLDSTGFEIYFKCFETRMDARYLRIELSRRLVNGTLNEEEAQEWLENYGFLNKEVALYALENIKNSRSHVSSYTFGSDLIKAFVNLNSEENNTSRWKAYSWLLTNIIAPSDLDKKILLP